MIALLLIVVVIISVISIIQHNEICDLHEKKEFIAQTNQKQAWRQEFEQELSRLLLKQKEHEYVRTLFVQDYMAIDDLRFEGFVAYVLNHYGFLLTALMQSGDKGKDLVGFNVQGHSIYGEVKHYSEGHVVGRDALQKLIGAGTVDNIESFIFVTTSDYSTCARDYAKECVANGIMIELIDGTQFAQMALQLREQLQTSHSSFYTHEKEVQV